MSGDLEKPETKVQRLRAALPALVGFVLFGVSLLVLSLIVIFTVLIWRNAASM